MAKFKYQSQVNTIIEWYNQGKSYADIARILNPSICGRGVVDKEAGNIRRLLIKQLGDIHGHPKKAITEDMKIQIGAMLSEGKKPKEIADALHIKYPTLGAYLSKRGFRFRPNPGNIHYFEQIDTYAKAYILGFIAADGALVPAKKCTTITLTITIKYEDKALLEFIKSEIGNEHPLLEIRRPNSFDKTKMIHHIRLSFSTSQIVHDIMKYGIKPNKSLTMGNIIKNIPYQYRDAFIIGYFDGDGSVTIKNGSYPNSDGRMVHNYLLHINIRGTKEFLTGICDHLNIDTKHIHQHDSIPCLAFNKKKDTYRFYQCYEHLPFYYKRKHDKFLQRINHPSYDKYKQVQTISSSVA